MNNKNVFVVMKQFRSNGLLCAIVKNNLSEFGHLCGYVGVTKEHPLHGKPYNKTCKALKRLPENTLLGKRSMITMLWRKRSKYESPEMYFDVHGSLTFSTREKNEKYPIEAPGVWWFGFDCNHGDDNPKKCNLEYVEKECRSLAKQLAAIKPEEVKHDEAKPKS